MKTWLTAVAGAVVFLSASACGDRSAEPGATAQARARQAQVQEDKGVFRSEKFGLSIRQPDGWYAEAPEKLWEVSQEGLDLIARDESERKQMGETFEEVTYPMFTFLETPPEKAGSFNASLNVAAENIRSSPQVARGSQYLDAVKNMLQATPMGYRFEDMELGVDIGGKTFDRLKTAANPAPYIVIRQDYYAMVEDGFAIIVIATYMNDDQKDTLEKAIGTIRFEQD